MFLVLKRNDEVDSVFQFESEQALDSWLKRFQQVVEPSTFEFLIIPKTEPAANLPSYDDPNSIWEMHDYCRNVERMLNAKVLCWHCNDERITILSDGWICNTCGQHGPPLRENEQPPATIDEGNLRNLPYYNLNGIFDNAEKIWEFSRPYVCVIHNPTGRGYYLNRKYSRICNEVRNIVRPGVEQHYAVPHTLSRCLPHETFDDQAASFDTPVWASEFPCNEFTSYWLY